MSSVPSHASQTDRKARDEERCWPSLLEVLGDALVDAVNRAGNEHDDEHADRDAEDRERGAHAVRPQCVEGDRDALEH